VSPTGNTPARAGTTAALSTPLSGSPEHPRAGGDDRQPSSLRPGHGGTPPRGRGRLRDDSEPQGVARNTPARAGTTTGCRVGWWRPTEHPRAGGDDEFSPPADTNANGTPPRGRGRRTPAPTPRAARRNTPARAGTTRRRWRGRGRSREHPRAGGDDVGLQQGLEYSHGTPPRGRGRHPRGDHRAEPQRNTPARAGTTVRRRSGCRCPREHPSAGGDDRLRADGAPFILGTPPRGRGRRRRVCRVSPGSGNTPARAGTTAPRSLTSSYSQEHPRAGGDDGMQGSTDMLREGTPPRGRGRLRGSHRPRVRAGNTPARAGTTRPTTLRVSPWTEHPRAGGDDRLRTAPDGAASGTPPRGRGRPTCRRRDRLKGLEHPRAGGDDPVDTRDGIVSSGTPPRGRGRQRSIHSRCGGERNTPARAGTTPGYEGTYWTSTEHPRAGGDDPSDHPAGLALDGTPPRGRGRPSRTSASTGGPRNTPARAGTTYRR